MSITITRSNGDVFARIADGVTNKHDAPIALVGVGSPQYAEDYANNWFHLLENFASDFEPCNPTTGMLWYVPPRDETSEPDLKVWTGTAWLPLAFRKKDDPLKIVQTAKKWETARSLTLFKDVTGTCKFDGSADVTMEVTVVKSAESKLAETADRWTNSRAITLSGEVEGTATQDGSRDTSITTRVQASVGASPNTIVRRDGSGNLTADRFIGTATQAIQLETSRRIRLQGDVTGSVFFDGTQNVDVLTTITGLRPTGTDTGTYQNPTVTVGADGRITAIRSGRSLPDILVNTNRFRDPATKNVAVNAPPNGADTANVQKLAQWTVTSTAAAVVVNATQAGYYNRDGNRAFSRIDIHIDGKFFDRAESIDAHPARLFYMGPAQGRVDVIFYGIVRSTGDFIHSFGLSEASMMEVFNP